MPASVYAASASPLFAASVSFSTSEGEQAKPNTTARSRTAEAAPITTNLMRLLLPCWTCPRGETERRAAEDERRHEREVAEAKKAKEEAPKMTMASEDLRISGSFEEETSEEDDDPGNIPMGDNASVLTHVS